MLPGQVIAGGVVSRTVTLKWQTAALPASSKAAQNTEVVPMGNSLPEVAEQKRKMLSGLEQLSVALAAYVAVLPAGLVHSRVWLAGHTITGA